MSKYDRFLDIHLTSSTGWYDFATEIELTAQYAIDKELSLYNGQFLRFYRSPIFYGKKGGGWVFPDAAGIDVLPDRGFVATVVPLDQLKERDPSYQKLIAWVSDTDHIGKVRFNCHGQPGGIMVMNKDAIGVREPTAQPANMLSYFLANNGMKQLKLERWRDYYRSMGISHGISTVNLNFCYGGLAGATLPSAVDDVASWLGKLGYKFVRITGSVARMATESEKGAGRVIEGREEETFIKGLGPVKAREQINSVAGMNLTYRQDQPEQRIKFSRAGPELKRVALS